MFFLFGWGRQTKKDLGPTVPMKCPNCNNTGFWHLLSVKVWFTLFFIPVFPYESKHFLLCPICSRGLELYGLQLEKARRLNQVTTAYLNKQMTEDQYRLALEETKIVEPPSETKVPPGALNIPDQMR